MNHDKIPQHNLNTSGNRMSNPPMSNPSFLSLAGLMAQAAATRSLGQGNPFMTGSQASQQSSSTSGIRFEGNNMINVMNSNGIVGMSGMSSGSLQADEINHDSPPSLISHSQGSVGQDGSQMQQSSRPNFSDWSWSDFQNIPEGTNALLERGRSRNWTYEETLELINMYTSDEWQGKFGSEKKNHRSIWVSLATALTKRKDVSGDEARQRLNNLKAFYNRTRRQLFSGEITSPQWEYWEPLHAFLGRPQPYLPLPPASPLPQFPHHFQSFQGNNTHNQPVTRRSPEGSPHSQLPCVSPHSSANVTNPHSFFGALGFPSHFGATFHSNGGSNSKVENNGNIDVGEKETTNEGEDRKMDMSSMVSANMTENSMGEIPGPSNEDQPMPLSPEQYLTEEMEPSSTPHSNSMPPRPESYKLRHNNHLSLVLESLAGDESFMDVTLTAQGKAIKAHKSVLSAVSSYFKSVLKANPCQHPIIIMPRDIQFEELNNIISYVYKGEMTVAAEDLPSLLRTAEVLQVTGLTPSDSSAMGSTSSSILGQIASRGTKPASSVVNQNIRASHSQTKSTNKKAPKFHSTPIAKEAQQNSSYGNDLSEKIDPLDFLNADMAYVKEEIESDVENIADTVNESEVSPGIDFHSPAIPTDSKLSDSLASHKSCPLSKKRKTSVDTSSLPANTGETEDNPDALPDDSLANQTALFVCPYCFQSHRPTEVLQSHLRLKHPSKPSFLCKCGKVNIRQSLYDQHVKTCDHS